MFGLTGALASPRPAAAGYYRASTARDHGCLRWGFGFAARQILRKASYRNCPPTACMVDPLGEVLMKLLPEGLKALFAPAAALPASVLTPPPTVVISLMVPVFAEPDAAAPALVPGREVPVCASAHSLDTASAVASRIAPSFIRHLLLRPKKWWTRRRTQSTQRSFTSERADVVNLHRTRRVGDWRELRGVRILLCRELSIDRIR